MVRLYLVRHGQTIWNKELRYQGHTDIPLSDEGRQQAEALAGRLKNESIDTFYASDLSRAMVTASIIARPHKKRVEPLSGLRETSFGKWEGLSFTEIEAAYGEEFKKWRTNPMETRIPGGETLQEVADRAMDAVRDIIAKHDGETVLAVAHGGIIRVVVGTILEANLNQYWRFKQDNVSLNIIEFYDGNGILCLYNDTSHLSR